jgi:hypothetical protein
MSQTKAQLVSGLNLNPSAPATALQIDASGNINLDSNTLYVDATNNRVGLGTSTPSAALHVTSSNAGGYGGVLYNTSSTGEGLVIRAGSTSSHNILVAQNYDGSAARFVVNAAGNVGIGTTGPTAQLDVVSSSTALRLATAAAQTHILFRDTTNSKDGYLNYDNGAFVFYRNGPSESFRSDSSGRLLVGTSSSRTVQGDHTPQIQVEGTSYQTSTLSIINNSNTADGSYIFLGKSRGTSIGSNTIVQNGDTIGQIRFIGSDGSGDFSNCAAIDCFVDGTPGVDDCPSRLVFSTTADGASSPTERIRITNDGYLLVGTTNKAPRDISGTTTGQGVALDNGPGGFIQVAGNGTLAFFNRVVSDGGLIDFRQDGAIEGNISVSGTTVFFNGAHLARWSQLANGAQRVDILRGSVLSNLDEMCEWGEEANEQLNRMKISDVDGDPNVAGVFISWDDDDDTYTDDFYCGMTGDFIIRIAEGVTVQRGDLLMSAGDGTAKPQDDDIIRSKTVAKVTSTHVTCTYEDGSYCVPCVLMAC